MEDQMRKPQTHSGGSASLMSCIANLAKTILGAGILALPGAFKGAGLVWGSMFTIVTAAIGVFSLGLLGEMSAHGGPHPSLAAIGERAAGTLGKRFVDIILVMNNTGAMTSYLVIASTTVSKLPGPATPRQSFVLLSVILISPLCVVREVNTLRFSSTIALFAISLLVVMIVLFAIPGVFQPCGDGQGTDCKGDVSMSKDPVSVLTQFVIFTNAYTCQQGAIPVIAELKDPTRRRKFMVALGAIGVVFPLFLLISIAGYTTFGDNVDSDILMNYPDGAFVTAARVGIIIDVLTSYPLMIYFTRTSMVNLLQAWCGCTSRPSEDESSGAEEEESSGAEEEESSGAEEKGLFISDKVEIIATVALVSFSTSISLAVSDLGIVAALTGAIGATSLGYVLPGFLFWKITGNEADKLAATQPLIPVPVEELASSSLMRNSAIALLVLGAILMPAGVALTLTQ